jgi:F-type H+-transporting ATPase subunit delta
LNGAVASRYAEALADVAQAHKNEFGVKRDLGAFAEVFLSSADLRNFLASPAAGREAKQKVIDEIAARMDLAPEVRNFLFVLVDNGRTGALAEIQQAFGEELNARLGIAEAEVTSSRGLSAAEKDELTAALVRKTGKKKIEARYAEDKTLLGGVRVRVGSTVYDGTVRERLNRLREQLEAE